MHIKSDRSDQTIGKVPRSLARNAACFIHPIALPRSTFISHLSNHDSHRCTLFIPQPLLRIVPPGRVAKRARLALSLSAVTGNSKNRAILSIDVGTSATKAALCFIDERGRLGPVSRVAYETTSPGNLQITQRVDDWFQATISASREALAGVRDDVDIVAIAVTGTCLNSADYGSESRRADDEGKHRIRCKD